MKKVRWCLYLVLIFFAAPMVIEAGEKKGGSGIKYAIKLGIQRMQSNNPKNKKSPRSPRSPRKNSFVQLPNGQWHVEGCDWTIDENDFIRAKKD